MSIFPIICSPLSISVTHHPFLNIHRLSRKIFTLCLTDTKKKNTLIKFKNTQCHTDTCILLPVSGFIISEMMGRDSGTEENKIIWESKKKRRSWMCKKKNMVSLYFPIMCQLKIFFPWTAFYHTKCVKSSYIEQRVGSQYSKTKTLSGN